MDHYMLDKAVQQAALESIDYDEAVYVIEGDDAGTRYYRTDVGPKRLGQFERVVYSVSVLTYPRGDND